MEKKRKYTLEALAQLTDSELVGDPHYEITGYADLESAKDRDISFLSSPRYTKTRYASVMKQSQAGAIFIAPYVEKTEGIQYLINKDPSYAFQIIIEMMLGDSLKYTYFEKVHPQAVVHPTAFLGNNVTVGPHAVIDGYVTIGHNTTIGAGSFIGPHTKIGEYCVIHPNVSIRENTEIGNQVIIQPGCVIGSCGFGFYTNEKGIHARLKQIGKVIIEDAVEIGANTTIDRARFTETRIGQGTKLDSNIVIGHNVKIGKHTLICGQSAIAGSTKIGNHVVIAGQCGIDGHLKIDDGVMISAKSGVTKSLSKGKYGGYPAQPIDQFNRSNVFMRQLEKHVQDIKEIKTRIEKLETK